MVCRMVGLVVVWGIYIIWMDGSGPRGWIQMDSVARAFVDARARTRGRRGIDDEGWERETTAR